ncbi:hypothetical protein BsWGS_05503 [Bradybaena similaris]
MLLLSSCSYSVQTNADNAAPSTDTKTTTNGSANANANSGTPQTGKGDNAKVELINFATDTGSSSDELDDSSEETLGLFNCSLPANLNRYCPGYVNDQQQAYFKYDLSYTGLLASIFSDDIVENLAKNCPTGSWCLPDSYHKDLKKGKSLFFSTNPICSDEIWSCLDTMLIEREDCDEKGLTFLGETVNMLCTMEEEEVLDPECYARILEALYVTFAADPVKVAESQRQTPQQTDCNGYRAQMTKTFLHAYNFENCTSYERSLLQKFGTWNDIVDNLDSTSAKCNLSYKNTDATPAENSDNFEDEDEVQFTDILQEMAHEMEEADEAKSGTHNGGPDGLNANANDDKQSDNNAMVIGAVILTTVMIAGFLGLALLSYRRCRARLGYDSLGYSKLGEEESNLLRGEFT